MNTQRLSLLSATLVTAIALLGAAASAEARERHTTVTGANGKTATRNVERSDGDVTPLPGAATAHCNAGDVFVIQTPTAGGYGTPEA